MAMSGYEVRVVGGKVLEAGAVPAVVAANEVVDGGKRTVYRFRFPVVTAMVVVADGKSYLRLGLAGCGKATAGPGMAELTASRTVLRVPQGRIVRLKPKVLAEKSFALKDEGLPEVVFPSQRPVVKQPGAMEFATFRQRAENGDDATGAASRVARLLPLGVQDGEQVFLLEVFPLAYDAGKGSLTLRQAIEVEVSSTADPALPLTENPTKGGAWAGKRLLVIAPDALLPGLAAFEAHKRSLGWVVDLVGTSVAGTTTGGILAHIRARYLVDDLRPSHLLLVGDSDTIPTWTGKGAYAADTDLYYACMDGENDWLPELYYGRLPAQSVTELAAMLTRIIRYETTVGGSTPYLSRAAFASSADNHITTEATHEAVIARHMVPRATSCDRWYSYTYHASGSQVLTAVNAGRGMMTYSGHGTTDRWLDPLVRVSAVQALANVGMPPLVLSFACDTGAFADLTTCFGEAWLKTPADTGAVGFIGSSEDTYWEEDDVFQKAVYDALFTDGVRLAGNLLAAAKMRYLAACGPSAETLQYFEQYHLLGDPTLALAVPAGTSVTDEVFAVRDLPDGCVTAGQMVAVTLQVAVGAAPPAQVFVREKLPTGWTVSNATWNGFPLTPTSTNGEYQWLLGVSPPVGNGTLRYETIATGVAGQTVVLSGSVLYGSTTVVTTGEQVIGISAYPDADGDGIPDSWELTYGLSPSIKSDAMEDWDGDGFTNGQEYACDTHPLERNSRLAITHGALTTQGYQLEWQGGVEATQYVERSEDLSDPLGWSVIWVNPPPTSRTHTFIDPGAAGSPRFFYRVRAAR
jgi:hypothetical protein